MQHRHVREIECSLTAESRPLGIAAASLRWRTPFADYRPNWNRATGVEPVSPARGLLEVIAR